MIDRCGTVHCLKKLFKPRLSEDLNRDRLSQFWEKAKTLRIENYSAILT